jgi:hypothetical protein
LSGSPELLNKDIDRSCWAMSFLDRELHCRVWGRAAQTPQQLGESLSLV